MTLMKKWLSVTIMASVPVFLASCGGDDGKNGADGEQGLTSLLLQTPLLVGDTQCFKGGVKMESGLDTNHDDILQPTEVSQTSYQCVHAPTDNLSNFNRIATIASCVQIDASCNTDMVTAAEIVAASSDGMTLIYTDSPMGQIGFVDITHPAAPTPKGVLLTEGEPTSIAVKEGYALVAVNQSDDFVNVAGKLLVVDIATQAIVHTLDLGGQPDSVAISPDGQFAVVVVENQRDEELGDGAPPQLPGGKLVVLNIADAAPGNWQQHDVDLTGVAGLYPADPEPEYVDINADNIAVVTLQENNHIVLVDLANNTIVNHFSAGEVDLENIDALDNRPALINPVDALEDVMREPDGVSWINNDYFATANEGDLAGGSRGFTVFDRQGSVVWDSGTLLENLAIRLGHYQDRRSDAKGNEPENIEMGVFGNERFLFVNSERSSLVFVFDVADPTQPIFKQALPSSKAPEGALAIPARNLLVVASEEDNRSVAIRAGLNIYRYNLQAASYPTLYSANRANGQPIPWSALSGLTADSHNPQALYVIEDSFFAANRIFAIDVSATPAVITDEIQITDSNNVLATSGLNTQLLSFTDIELAAMINADKSVNIDAEGIAQAVDGGFWIASEGAGAAANATSINFILKTSAQGVIESVIHLPEAVNNLQINNGFEGIAEYNNSLYVVFQRGWAGEAHPRIGIYDLANKIWAFVYYPLDTYSSQYPGGWVGLSEITALGNGEFMVLERDNRGGMDAAIKRLYRINLQAVTDGQVITKTLIKDLIPNLTSPKGTLLEKVEGTALMNNGDVYIVTDNDGVNDHTDETQLLNLGKLF